MGLQLKIPEVLFSDSDLPRIYSETILTDGSILLIDPSHPHNPYTGGGSGKIPNIAESKAMSLVSGSTDVEGRNITMTGTTGLVERTSKGGIHAIITENDLSGVVAYEINLPDNVRDYMHAKINTNKFYISLWHNVTRSNPDSVRKNFSGLTHNDLNYLWVFDVKGDLPALGSEKRIGSHQTGTGGVLGSVYRSIGVNGPTIGWGSFGTPNGKSIFRVGDNTGWNKGSGYTGDYPSQIFYRAYIEDLTVSGRTYEEVDAIDYDLYQKEVLTAGGRYYGDTFTSPSTLP